MRPVIVALCGLGLGLGVGLLLRGPAKGPGTDAECPLGATVAGMELILPSMDCATVEAATAWCLGRLEGESAASEATLPLRPIADPEGWAEDVRRAFAHCQIPATLVTTDCTEAPCVATMRRNPEATRDVLSQALADCRHLDGHVAEDVSAFVWAWPVHCPDGKDELMDVLSFEGEALLAVEDLLPPEGEYESFSASIYAVANLGRRVKQVAGQWPCDDQEPGEP